MNHDRSDAGRAAPLRAVPLRAALACAALLFGPCAGAAAAPSLLQHRVSYALALDASRASQKLEAADGRIDYELKGDACAGYTVNMHQANSLDTGEGPPVSSDMLSTSWEDGKAEAYRFKNVSRMNGKVKSDVDALVSRAGTGLTVQITKPSRDTVDLKGPILLPTEHVRRLLAAAMAGEATLEARVFDGSDDGRKVYATLAVIGRPGASPPTLPEEAKAALAGQTFYPVTVSYFDAEEDDQTPSYVMSMSLYESGVIGALRIDYNDFVLRGTMQAFEALKPAKPCAEDAGK